MRCWIDLIMFFPLRYYWRFSKGYRFCPWRSPYLRWRIETYFAVPADRLTRQEFFCLLWRERRRLRNFLRWASEVEKRYLR